MPPSSTSISKGDEVFIKAVYLGRGEVATLNGQQVDVALVVIDGSKASARVPASAVIQKPPLNVVVTKVDRTENRPELSRRIRELRQAKNISQKSFGFSVGVGQSAVGHWESGRSYPRTDLLPKVAEVLGVTLDELMEGTMNDGFAA